MGFETSLHLSFISIHVFGGLQLRRDGDQAEKSFRKFEEPDPERETDITNG